MNCTVKKTQLCLVVVALFAAGAFPAKAATAPAAANRLSIRGLSTQDVKDYSLGTAQCASGLSTVGVGQAVYLETLIPLTTPAASIVGVEFSLANKPVGSAAALQTSPLGENVPVGAPTDRLAFRIGGRTMLRPDVEGTYTVNAIVTSTNGVSTLTKNITAGRFLGYSQGCVACHSGGLLAQNMTSFTNTPHATAFQRKIDDSTGHFGKNCISCHAVGFDSNTNAVNGGFDDVMLASGWQFPATLTNGNWAAMPAALKNVANVQCENCHGPGSRHVVSDGILGNTNAISISMDSATCGQCHDAKTHHIKSPEWANSGHAVATRDPSGPGREGCVGCHTAKGFTARMKGQTPTDTSYEPIGCATCHDPHAIDNPHQLRYAGDINLMDGITTVKNAGMGALCMKCHYGRRNAATYVETTTGGSTFGPHHSNQADMLAGANGITYGKVIPSSAHGKSVENSCVGCHMQETAATDVGFTQVGGHTFKVAANIGTNRVELTEACISCHGEMEDFNMATQDYDGDGVIMGVQDEVKGLLRQLAKLLPPVGVAKETISINSSWTKQQLRAGFNWRFVGEEGSFGIHNTAFAVGLLKASIADLTGDANHDGLPDAWQVQYFGSANNPDAAPNAVDANGMPNWLKYSLGIAPGTVGTQVPGGIVWANASSIGGSTNTIQIFTAAEVAFNTEAGKTYQLQSISSLGGGWSNVGQPVAGTGSSYSFVTPTRSNVQQYFRVVTQ